MNNIGRVYLIKNLLNGKLYVGQTVKRMSARWRAHCSSKKCTALAGAIKKYGAENFQIEILAECSSIDEMNRLEKKYIDDLNTIAPNGYNLRAGGENSLHSMSSRLLMSKARVGHKMSEESRRRISNSKRGVKIGRRPQEVYDRIGLAQVGKFVSDETRQKQSAAKARMKRPVEAIHLIDGARTLFESMRAASKALHIPTSAIYVIAHRRKNKKTYKGYTFNFIKEEHEHS